MVLCLLYKFQMIFLRRLCIFSKTKVHNFRMENVENSEIEQDLPFMIPDHVY
jgi:hypothetical protein